MLPPDMPGEMEFENLVNLYYASLYRFALSLTRQESDAADLTQETFRIWALKGHQLNDRTKVRSWLFTTLHRLFLEKNRRQQRFPHHELEEVSGELPEIRPEPALVSALDGKALLVLIARLNPLYQPAICLFYLEDHSYREIAEILDIPIGTVKSRLSRGLLELQHMLRSELVERSRIAP